MSSVVAHGVTSAIPETMRKNAVKLTTRFRPDSAMRIPPATAVDTPSAAARGTIRRILDSVTDRSIASLGLEDAASRAGGSAASSVAPTPSAAAFATSTGSSATPSTDTVK